MALIIEKYLYYQIQLQEHPKEPLNCSIVLPLWQLNNPVRRIINISRRHNGFICSETYSCIIKFKGPFIILIFFRPAVGVLINDAIVNTCKGRRIVLMGQNGAVNETICQNDIVSKGLSIFGNYIGNYIMSRTVKMLEAGVIPVEKIITHKLPMSKFAEGLDAMRKGVGLEVILYPDEN